MYCFKCGSLLKPGAKFCVKCGAPVEDFPEDLHEDLRLEQQEDLHEELPQELKDDHQEELHADLKEVISETVQTDNLETPVASPALPENSKTKSTFFGKHISDKKPKESSAQQGLSRQFSFQSLLNSKVLLLCIAISVIQIVFWFIPLITFQWKVSFSTNPIQESWSMMTWFSNSNFSWLGYLILILQIICTLVSVVMGCLNKKEAGACFCLISAVSSFIFLILLVKDVSTFKSAIKSAVGSISLSAGFYIFVVIEVLFLLAGLFSLYSAVAHKKENDVSLSAKEAEAQ